MDTRLQTCAACQGEGYTLYLEAAGAFSDGAAAYTPQEGYARCPACDGEGEVEVCAHCLAPFEIKDGLEVCACAEIGVRLPQAA